MNIEAINIDFNGEALDAYIMITCNGKVLTKAQREDENAPTDTIYVSSRYLAYFLLGNFWRILYEPTPKETSCEYECSHQLVSAGNGYVWPEIKFSAVGDTDKILVSMTPSDEYGIKYLTEANEYVDRNKLKNSILRFLEELSFQIRKQNLNDEYLDYYKEFIEEVEDPEYSEYRILEARLGLDPGEDPEQVKNYCQKHNIILE